MINIALIVTAQGPTIYGRINSAGPSATPHHSEQRKGQLLQRRWIQLAVLEFGIHQIHCLSRSHSVSVY